MVKAVIFDLDGTLLNTLQDLGEAVEYALQACKIPVSHTMDEYRLLVGHGVANLLKYSVEGVEVSSRRLEELRKQFDDYYQIHSMDHVSIYPGILDLVHSLKKNGIHLAVLTNKPHIFAREMVMSFFGKGLFEVIQGQKDGLPRKPNPATALLAAEKMGCAPAECVFVGDSETDMQTAVNASMFPVGVLWGFRTRRDLKENGAQILVETAEELHTILIEKIEKKSENPIDN